MALQVNDCGLKPARFLPRAKRDPFFAAAKKWAASAEARLQAEAGNGCAPLLPEGKQLPRTRSHSAATPGLKAWKLPKPRKPQGELRRSTLKISARKDLAVYGILAIALAIFVFLTLSYQAVFMTYAVLSIFIFSVYLMLWNEKAADKHFADPKLYPHVTIIIPSYNSKKTIFDCIKSCKASDYPGRMDIIVIDDCSSDGSYEMLCRMEGIKVYRKQKNAGKAAALNFGLAKAKGEIVACVDSDTYLSRDTIRKTAKHFHEGKDVGSVVAFVCTSAPKNLLQRIQEIEYWVSLGFFFKTLAMVDGLYVTPGPTALYRKKALLSLGGYDEHNLCEDLDIALRLHKAGYKIKACHETMVRTDVPETLPQLYKQRLRWYRGGAANMIKHVDLFDPKYGQFGLFVLPTMLGSGFVAALFMAWTGMFMLKSALSWAMPFAYDFNAGISLTMIGVGNGLFVIHSGWVLGMFSVALWGYFLLKSFELAHTRFSGKYVLPLVIVAWIYPLFIGTVFMISYIYELFGAKYSW